MATTTSVRTDTTTSGVTDQDRLAAAARRMYDAEGTLHVARQAHIDEWVSAAYDQLHLAIAEHTACLLHLAS